MPRNCLELVETGAVLRFFARKPSREGRVDLKHVSTVHRPENGICFEVTRASALLLEGVSDS